MIASILVLIVALLFVAMAAIALMKPEKIVAVFGTPALTTSGRNEVRAVYGGYGLSVAMILAMAIVYDPIRVGVLYTIISALLGMAAGRLISAFLDRRLGRAPRFFLALELLLAAMLFIALRLFAM